MEVSFSKLLVCVLLENNTPYSTKKYSHTDDILCVAYGDPHYLATGSFDGEVSSTIVMC